MLPRGLSTRGHRAVVVGAILLMDGTAVVVGAILLMDGTAVVVGAILLMDGTAGAQVEQQRGQWAHEQGGGGGVDGVRGHRAPWAGAVSEASGDRAAAVRQWRLAPCGRGGWEVSGLLFCCLPPPVLYAGGA